MASKSKLSVVVDIGTSKIVAAAGFRNEEGKIEIAGIASGPSKGIKRGVVFNIEDAASSIKKVLTDLVQKTREDIEIVDVAYAGMHIKTIDFKASRMTSDEGIVTRMDLEYLNSEARNIRLENNYKVIKVIPKIFIVDNEAVAANPVGITGRKIEATYKLVVLPESYLTNLERVFDKIGIQMGELSLSTLAVSEAVLTDDEKEMGVILLDIGAGTSKMAVYHENMLIHTAVVPFAGDVITQDIKEGCSILLKWAQQLKEQYGQALGDFADEQKVVTIPGFNGWESKEISFKSLAFIIQARLEEIVDSIYQQIERTGIESQLGAGIVLSGGTANIENLVSLVKFRTGLDARKANLSLQFQPKTKELSIAENYTALGLLSTAVSKTEPVNERERKKPVKTFSPGKTFSARITNIVQGVLNMVDDENEDIPLN